MTVPNATDVVGAGDHACLTFTDGEERLDLIAAFVRGGLKAGHKVVCWTDAIDPDGLAAELADRAVRPGAAMRRGQLRLSPVSDSLLGGGAVTATAMMDVLSGELEA